MRVYTKKAYSVDRFGFSRLSSGVLPREHNFLQHVKCLVSESACMHGKKKRVPDVEATRPGTRHIVEVETKDTYEAHADQRTTFKKSARKRRRTKYKEEVV